MRGRPAPCRARQLPTDRLNALIWADRCRVLTDPTVLAEAVRQVRRLVDAYEAAVLTLDELRQRRPPFDAMRCRCYNPSLRPGWLVD